MMTIVTRVKLREGCEPRWDAAMRERLEAARNQAGWIAGQVAIPIAALDERVRPACGGVVSGAVIRSGARRRS